MSVKKADLQVTSFYTQINSSLYGGLSNHQGLIVFGYYTSTTGNPPTVTSTFAPGCILLNTAGTGASDSIKGNAGTTAAPVWTTFTIS